MESKERVLLALNHEEPDRVPINFRATDRVVENVSNFLKLDYEGILDHFKVDFRELLPKYIGPELKNLNDGSEVDIWGVGRKEVIIESSRDVLVSHNPLKEVNDIAELEKYLWPTPDIFDFSQIDKTCSRYNGYAISTEGLHAEGYHGVFHLLTYLFGMEKVMMDLVLNEELINSAIEKIMNFFMGYYDKLLKAGKGQIDFLFYKDDFGTQNSLLISRDMFAKFFAPTLKKLASLAESYGATLILHSCGSVASLIPDFIDLGIKVLDPIQVLAKDMDIRALKDNYGDKLTFHGAIDTQQLLPFGKPEDVRKSVLETVSVLGKNGGYFFSPSHRFQQDTPTDNIIAMYEAVINNDLS